MSLPSRSARLGRASSRLSRAAAAGVLALGLTAGAAGCGVTGKDVQTLNPYTPTEGVNTDVGAVRLRNVTVLSRAEGMGILSASLVSAKPDSLTSVTGEPIKADGSAGPAFTAKLPAPVTVGSRLIVLTNQAPITITSPDLKPGLTAKMTFTFRDAGAVTTFVPVIDGTTDGYETATPGASPSAPITPSR